MTPEKRGREADLAGDDGSIPAATPSMHKLTRDGLSARRQYSRARRRAVQALGDRKKHV